MSNDRYQSGERLLLRVGAVAAIVGTVLQVAAGTSQSALLGGAGGLASLAGLPDWVWPSAYLGFIFGALLWVAALVAVASVLTDGPAWALARLSVAAAFVGASLHAVDGSLNAGGLASLARAWTAAPASERAVLEQNGEFLLRILDGTWAGVITLYHGVPFVLAGLAVALSRLYPAWLGWMGVVGGRRLGHRRGGDVLRPPRAGPGRPFRGRPQPVHGDPRLPHVDPRQERERTGEASVDCRPRPSRAGMKPSILGRFLSP